MIRRYRLIVLGELGQVWEWTFSRAALLYVPSALLLGFILALGSGFAMGVKSVPALRAMTTDHAALPDCSRRAPAFLPVVSAQPQAPETPCAPDMILVQGNFCPSLQLTCKTQMDPEGSALRGHRCAEYRQPARCQSLRKSSLRYCIDRDEYRNEGEPLPQSGVTFEHARTTCEQRGKRLCTDVEWTFACEGEAGAPYPYGWARDTRACNADRDGLVNGQGELNDLRAAAGAFPRCTSAFGVRDLTGNVEEYAMDASSGQPLRKGGYWQPGPNHCRHALPHQELTYRGVEVGFRCCSDPARP